eukprot:6206599-Pyramimonas_sp.AAC.1
MGRDVKYHKATCPARLELRDAMQVEFGKWEPVLHGPHAAPPLGWWIATDGSGLDGEAGWGAVIFRYEGPGSPGMVPDFVLHAPVVCRAWDHRWIGARSQTNNTAELSAIGEVMHWLLNEAPDGGAVPVHIRYDSEYAANTARGLWEVKSNEELAETVRGLTEQVMARRQVTWEHVYGHTGVHDNELADRAADLGRQGMVSEQSLRWLAPPPQVAALRWQDIDYCKKCGIE